MRVIIHENSFISPTHAVKALRNLVAKNIDTMTICLRIATEKKEIEKGREYRTGFVLCFLQHGEMKFHVIGDLFKVKVVDGLHDADRYINHPSFREVKEDMDEERFAFFFVRTFLNIFAIPMFVHQSVLFIPRKEYRDERYMSEIFLVNGKKIVEDALKVGAFAVPEAEDPSLEPWEGD